MTLSEIRQALKEDKKVRDYDWAEVHYADEDGYFRTHFFHGKEYVPEPNRYAYFFISGDWPKPGNKFFALSFDVKEHDFNPEDIHTRFSFGNGNAFRTLNEAFRTGEKLIDKLKPERK